MFVKDTEYLLIQPALVPLAQVRDGDPVLGHGDPGVGGVQGSLVLQPDPARAQLQPRVHQHLLTVDGVTLCPWGRHSRDFLTPSLGLESVSTNAIYIIPVSMTLQRTATMQA